MRIAAIGDIMGRSGRTALIERLPGLKRKYALDFIIVNAENAAGGFGVTPRICEELLEAGADVLTTGNHAYDQRDDMAKSKARPTAYKVKNVALMTGVSVRTLHYYDEIGLLTPGDRTEAGYRLYSENDLLRLQQILIGRSTGLSLEDIRRSLDDPAFDYARSLRKQREALVEKLTETHKMIAAIDATLSALEAEDKAARAVLKSGVDFKAIFDGFDPDDYADEAKARWGESDACAQSAKRTQNYTEADWRAIKEELDAIWTDAAAAMRARKEPDSAEALRVVERHRRHICRWFYDITPAAHAQLADMWETDERFRKAIDKYGEGLTDWLAPAVRAAAALE